jgi:F-type H+-transporting ATPase subunit gamma
MASVRQIRTRIRSVRNIRQITRAMKMVASARLNKAQTQLLEARPYAAKMREVIVDISARAGQQEHPLLERRASGRKAVLVLTSDKGLCAGFNAQPLHACARRLQSPEGAPDILCVGKKGLAFFRRVGVKPVQEWAGFWQELAWQHVDEIGQQIIDGFVSGKWSEVTLVYNRFKSIMTQLLTEETLLPIRLDQAASGEPGPAGHMGEYAFEPSSEEVLRSLLPRYVKQALWHAFLESKAAELAARMSAMDSATRSAGDMIEELTLVMNRARQAGITREISELVGGAEAINN